MLEWGLVNLDLLKDAPGGPPGNRIRADLMKTQIVADVAKMVETWNGDRPISRAAGGRITKSIACPIPTHTRQKKSR